MNILITVFLLALNGYFAVRSFKQKRWGWAALSGAITLLMVYDLFLVIR